MNSEPSPSSPAVNELNNLFREGAEKGLWKEGNKSAFARAIQIERRRLLGLLNGERSDDAVLPVVEMVRDVVETGELPPETESPEAQGPMTEFNRFYATGIEQGLWKNMQECGAALDMSATSIRKYRDNDPATFKAREKSFHGKAIAKMRKLVRPPKQQKKRSPSQKSVEQPQQSNPGDLASLISGPAVQRIAELEEKLPSLIQNALSQSGQKEADSKEAVEAPDGVIPSPWAKEVIAGRMEIEDQQRGNTRFVVTKDTIRTLLAEFNKDDLEDTNEFATILANGAAELRRRLTLLPQLQREEDRANAVRTLVPALSNVIREMVALAVTVEEVREIDVDKALTKAAKAFDSLSELF